MAQKYIAPQEIGFYVGAIEVDTRHQIGVWRDGDGSHSYFPMYLRGDTWTNYKRHGLAIAYSSYPAGSIVAQQRAINYIQRGLANESE